MTTSSQKQPVTSPCPAVVISVAGFEGLLGDRPLVCQ